ncbi:MAG: methyltransferase domain-containing protein [Elusimicrobia bacterium]|nr:methyltransferase domain-containing protein [Elusimicrobiota bacterium]
MADNPLFYDAMADDWDERMDRREVAKRLRLVFGSLLTPEEVRGRRTLDAGCGTGRFSKVLADWGASLVSLDIGPALVEKTRRRTGARAVCGDLTGLPFEDAAFDVVLSTEAVEHTRDPRRAVAELCRVVAPGGTLVLTTPNRLWHPAITLATRLRLRPYAGIENWAWPGELRGWVRGAGLTVVRSQGFNLLPHTFFCGPAFDALDRVPGLAPLMINTALKAARPR